MGYKLAAVACLSLAYAGPYLPAVAPLPTPSIEAQAQQPKYFVAGVVAKPGAYRFDTDAKLTVASGIERAGGLAYRLTADKVSMWITRKDSAGTDQAIAATLADAILSSDVLVIRER